MRPESAASRVAREAMPFGARGCVAFAAFVLGSRSDPMAALLFTFFAALIDTIRRRLSDGPLRASWPFGFELVVRYLRRDWESTSDWPTPRLRAALDARPYPKTILKQLDVRDGQLAGLEARWFTPRDARPGVVLFFHGGSYHYGSIRTTHAEVAARVALEARVEVVGVDYRLAPEHPYPAQLEDARRAFDALLAAGRRADEIVLAGDSAGGNLAIELQLALRDAAEPQARGAVLVSPWSDLEMSGASFVENDPFDFGTRDVLVRQAEQFAGEVPLSDPRLSPVHADLTSLAPCLVTVGECEIPRDDIVRLAERLEAAGVDTALHRAADMPHNAPLFAAYHPAGAEAVRVIGRWIVERLSR